MTAKTIVTIIAIIVCILLIVGCNIKPNNKKDLSKETPTDDGNTTISQEFLIMEIDYAPGGPLSQEEFDNGCNNFKITSKGHITDKNNTKVTLSDEDMDEVLRLYKALCDGNTTDHKDSIMDGPSYMMTIHNGNKILDYIWDYNYQVEEVKDIMKIIWKYY